MTTMSKKSQKAKAAVTRAIKLAGGPAKVSEAIQCQLSSVYFWISGDRNISPANAARLSKLIGNAVKPEQMRPDFEWPHIAS